MNHLSSITNNNVNETRIPRIIHYCWFGGKEMPELAIKCIESWKKYLPDYELRLWNEETFDLDMYPYAREAYDNRKFAFVTDVVRLWALEKFGGVYMDTDVEILRPLDAPLQIPSTTHHLLSSIDNNGSVRSLMDLPAFTGYEGCAAHYPVTGLMASAAHGVWVTEQLAYYNGKHFVDANGSLDLTPNTEVIGAIMEKGGFINTGNYEVYKGDLHVFPVDYFCPRNSSHILKLTENTYCIHHFAGSWRDVTFKDKLLTFIYSRVLGWKLTNELVQIKRKLKRHILKKQ